MKKQFFENEKDGFYGTYYENPKGMIRMIIWRNVEQNGFTDRV